VSLSYRCALCSKEFVQCFAKTKAASVYANSLENEKATEQTGRRPGRRFADRQRRRRLRGSRGVQAEDSDRQEVHRQTGRRQKGEIDKREDRKEADKKEADTEFRQAIRQTGRGQIGVDGKRQEADRSERQAGKRRTGRGVNRHSSR
jgi:hypothetical protein